MTSIFLPVSTGLRVLEPHVVLALDELLRRRRRSRRERGARRARRARAISGTRGEKRIDCVMHAPDVSARRFVRCTWQRRLGHVGADREFRGSQLPATGSELDHRDVEAALARDRLRCGSARRCCRRGRGARDSGRPCRAACPAARWPPSRRARAAPSGSRRPTPCANEPACSQKRSRGLRRRASAPPWRLSPAALSARLVGRLRRALSGACAPWPARRPRGPAPSCASAWTFGSSTPGRIL